MACNRISSIIELLNSLLLPPKRASHSSKVCMVSETHENLAARVGEFSIWIRTQFDMSLLKYSIYFVQFDLMKVSKQSKFLEFTRHLQSYQALRIWFCNMIVCADHQNVILLIGIPPVILDNDLTGPIPLMRISHSVSGLFISKIRPLYLQPPLPSFHS